ncbi:MAG: hypothetical protein H0X39_12405 [Actinobacteria bacterium]|nr:hypothetical protein [Actinomycetota bacterium]
MLADQLDYIVGVDPHRDTHALAVVEVASGAVIVEATVVANNDSYTEALRLVEEHATGRRVFAIEGTGSYGLALDRHCATTWLALTRRVLVPKRRGLPSWA